MAWSMPLVSHEGTPSVSCVLSIECVENSLRCTAASDLQGVAQSVETGVPRYMDLWPGWRYL